MAIDPDAYGIWGDWNLDQFKVKAPHWRDTTHPPDDVYGHVNRWWPALKQPSEWSGAAQVSRENDPEGNLRWMWVPIPGNGWLSEDGGYFRVQCRFRVYEDERPPRLACEEFRTVQSLTPTEVDRADGMG